MHHAELGAIGTTFRRAGQAGLGYYTLGTPQLVRALHDACGFAQSVYVATCNRVEVFFVASPGEPIDVYRDRLHAFFARHRQGDEAVFTDPRKLTAYAGEGAVEHLFVVCSALDSMVPGEAQILGQVKAAWREADEMGLVGPLLAEAFAEAFAVAKHVREHTALGRGRTSMFSLAATLIEERIDRLHSSGRSGPAARSTPRPEAAPKLRFAILGVGKMAEAAGRWAQRRGDVALQFVNRTYVRAQQLAATYGGEATELAEYLRCPNGSEVVLCATASPTPLLTTGVLAQLAPNALLLDLAVSRDVDSAAAHDAGCELWDIDRLQGLAAQRSVARQGQVAQARRHVDEALERYRRRTVQRGLSAALGQFRRNAKQLLDREVSAAAKDDPKAAHVLTTFGQRLLGHWLHDPTLALKHLGHRYGLEAVEAFVDGPPRVDPPLTHEPAAAPRQVPPTDLA